MKNLLILFDLEYTVNDNVLYQCCIVCNGYGKFGDTLY